MNNTRGHQENSVKRAGMVSPAPLGLGILDPLLRKVSAIPEWLIGARNEVHLLEALATPTQASGMLTSVPSEHSLLICDLRAPHWNHTSYALYPDTSLTSPLPHPVQGYMQIHLERQKPCTEGSHHPFLLSAGPFPRHKSRCHGNEVGCQLDNK